VAYRFRQGDEKGKEDGTLLMRTVSRSTGTLFYSYQPGESAPAAPIKGERNHRFIELEKRGNA